MILLRHDCLVFRTSGGDSLVCSAGDVAAVLLGEAAGTLGDNFLSNAVEAVVHFFKFDQERTVVSIDEFSAALVKVLRGFGFDAREEPAAPPLRVADTDLSGLACDSGKAFELLFFSRLRNELRTKLREAPHVIRFSGLRSCVKQLTGARRWGRKCQRLNDQIVEYLRKCLGNETVASGCALLVR